MVTYVRSPRSRRARATWLVTALAVALAVPIGVRSQEDPEGTQIHRVRRGENLSVIADRFQTTVAELRAWNDLRGSRILVGQELRVPRIGNEYYVVRRGDTLSEIADQLNVSLTLLRQLNGINGSRIHPGQKLKLQPSHGDEPVHVVRRGETLGQIATLHGVGLKSLRALNGVKSDRIYVGQKLRLRDIDTGRHVVERGDALWEIAKAYRMSVGDLKSLNDLRTNRIYPGQELRVRAERSSSAPRWATHVVRPGDTLGQIAQLHQMSVSELRRSNSLNGSLIRPGQRLRVRPLLGDDDSGLGLLSSAEIPWAKLLPKTAAVPVMTASNGPYLFSKPRATAQRSGTYREGSGRGPKATYKQARLLWETFDAKVASLGRISRSLEGLTVILDPGHGGIDPGTVVSTRDGNKQSLHVVEDEYVYDIALRAAVLLRLHGAKVEMTLLSPNHLLRTNQPATATFVNEQNEVYNNVQINRRNVASAWPRGGARGLRKRLETAKALVRSAGRDKTLFVSLHADNSPRSPEAVTIYHGSRDRKSKQFAKVALAALGAGSRVRAHDYYVLRHSPADLAVLIELRNLAYPSQAWALRDAKLRHRDAEKVVKGILDWAQTGALDKRMATRTR